jgi:hypothetical protein
LKPRYVFRNSEKKIKFICPDCNHIFSSRLHDISKGKWCPYCKNKTERKLKEWLETLYKIQNQPKYEWCKNPDTNKFLPFDFSIEDLKLIIELDGAQHFKQVSNWKCHKETTKRDIYKMNKAVEQGYTVIRLLQENVYYDRTDWKMNLKNVIKSYDEPQVIFIAKCDTYKNHKELLDSE